MNNFSCYDGETIKGKMILLGNDKDFIYKKSGLSSLDCLKFLVKPNKKKRIFFNLHYDIQFIVKDFKDLDILDLMNSKEVSYKGFTLQYYQNKMLIIKKNFSIIKYYDIVSFFNTSLLNIIKLLNIKLTNIEQHILEKGKDLRAKSFRGMTKDEMILYNRTECIVTNRIAQKIQNLMLNSIYIKKDGKEDNLNVKNFYGSSAIAGKLLKVYEIDKLKKFPQYQEIFQSAYYGGRFEVLKLGTFKKVYKYDINSAYPSVMKDLKVIRKFVYKKHKNLKHTLIIDEGIYRIYFKLLYPRDFICPFPLRHNTGRLFFTGEVSGYYFGCEIKAFLKTKIHPDNYILIITESLTPVFYNRKIFDNPKGNLITELYSLRQKYKKANDIKHYIYKISLNSMYGKLAQTVGKSEFQNLYFAGYITAKTRAKIYEKSFSANYNNIIGYATDSIISMKPLKVSISDKLGEWSMDKCKKAEVIMSGFYRLETDDNIYLYGLRGFKIDRNSFNKILTDIDKKGFSKIFYPQFITHKLYLANKKAFRGKRLKFVNSSKVVNPVKANFKRSYKHNGIFSVFSKCNSDFIILPQIESSNKFKNSSILNDFIIDY